MDGLAKKLSTTLSADHLSTLAKQAGFKMRKSKFTEMKFLRMLLFDHLLTDQPSLQQHGFSVYHDSQTKISKQGIDKRFNAQAVKFIQLVFQHYFEHQSTLPPLSCGLQKKFSSIRVMDSTEFKLPARLATAFPGYSGDGTKACAQIQFEFDALSGKVMHLSIEKALVSDKTFTSKCMSTVKEGDLLLRDLGYYSVSTYKAIELQGAFYISRLKQQISIYEKTGKGFKKLTHASIKTKLKKSKRRYLDLQVYIGKDVRHPVRLIANLLDEKAVTQRIKNKKHRKTKLNKADKLACQLNLFVTNIPRSHSTADDKYQLYKIRWQVELIFKIWKSVLKIHLIRTMKAERLKCYLLSKLLWVMLSWEICTLHGREIWADINQQISLYKCFSLLKLQAANIKVIVFSKRYQVKQWLKNVYHTFIDYGLKEDRVGRVSLISLMEIE